MYIILCCTEGVSIVVCSKGGMDFQATLTDIFLNANVIYVQLVNMVYIIPVRKECYLDKGYLDNTPLYSKYKDNSPTSKYKVHGGTIDPPTQGDKHPVGHYRVNHA